ncbi:MAG: 4Fe-4S binding protein, partial [Desulfomonilaceae bacterium]|nr:4Fe-4S binding protein [Desulfomonilaceae bacterium]
MAYSEITEFSGEIGNFHVKVHRKARYIDESKCTACGACAEKCPTKVPNEFNFGLDERKAVYKDYAQGIPSVYTIDPDHCKVLQGKKCGVCAKVCQAKAVDYEQKDSDVELDVAAVIVSTGYELFDATQISEYGYGRFPNVISSLEMERLLSAGGPTKGHLSRPSVVHGEARLAELGKLIKRAEKAEDAEQTARLQAERTWLEDHVHKYHTAKKLGFIQCVGSRDFRFHKYCSSYCCMHSIKEAIIAREHEPETESYIFYMDLRTVGKGFEEYKVRGAEVSGLKYIRGRVAEVLQDEDLNPVVYYEDTEQRKVVSMTLDMVILANACSASKGIVKLA